HVLDEADPGGARFRSGFDLLRATDLFAPVADGELKKFAALGQELRVEKGALMSRAEDEPPPLGLILEGEALLSWKNGREELLLRELEPGDLLGEVEVFEGGPFEGGWGGSGTRARAVTPVR